MERWAEEGVDWRQIANALAYPLGEGIAAWLASLETPAQDAQVEVRANGLAYIPHREGCAVNREALLQALAACFAGKEAPPLRLEPTMPSLPLARLRAVSGVSGEYRTHYADRRARQTNLQLACHALNGTVIPPHGEFSFNATVGPRTSEAGYKPAPVLVEGRHEEGIGGGVCQVSTTLYNAALLAGMRVVEAHPHSAAVGYVAPARDAMVSGWSDLRLANDSDYPCYLFASAQEGVVRVRIRGVKPTAPVRLRTERRVLEEVKNLDEEGHELASLDGYTLVHKGSERLEAALWQEGKNGRRLLRRNVYRGQPAVWRKAEQEAAWHPRMNAREG